MQVYVNGKLYSMQHAYIIFQYYTIPTLSDYQKISAISTNMDIFFFEVVKPQPAGVCRHFRESLGIGPCGVYSLCWGHHSDRCSSVPPVLEERWWIPLVLKEMYPDILILRRCCKLIFLSFFWGVVVFEVFGIRFFCW